MGVNPRGSKPRTSWQMGVMHISEFERLAYVHVTINTFSFSHVIPETSRTGGTIKKIKAHSKLCGMGAKDK